MYTRITNNTDIMSCKEIEKISPFNITEVGTPLAKQNNHRA